MNQPIIPPQSDRNKEAVKRSMWTLSYRLQGMTIGLIVSAIYCYVFLHAWSKTLIIASGILGYALGWAVGYFMYTKK